MKRVVRAAKAGRNDRCGLGEEIGWNGVRVVGPPEPGATAGAVSGRGPGE